MDRPKGLKAALRSRAPEDEASAKEPAGDEPGIRGLNAVDMWVRRLRT